MSLNDAAESVIVACGLEIGGSLKEGSNAGPLTVACGDHDGCVTTKVLEIDVCPEGIDQHPQRRFVTLHGGPMQRSVSLLRVLTVAVRTGLDEQVKDLIDRLDRLSTAKDAVARVDCELKGGRERMSLRRGGDNHAIWIRSVFEERFDTHFGFVGDGCSGFLVERALQTQDLEHHQLFE